MINSFRMRPSNRVLLSQISAAAACAIILGSPAGAEDHRSQPPKDLDGYFPFSVSASAADWNARAAKLRLQMRVALGLFPEPQRTPLNPVIHGELDRGDYTVAKVYFESLPGFFVTGNLYRPKGASGRSPGVLSPHGHWNDGRFYDNGEANTRAQIGRGEEQFIEGGRSPLQARAVGLARLGCVVFHYDMIGYADCTQLSFELAHKHAKQRLAMNTRENWGLYAAQAEAQLQNVMGLQTWNSIRALDFLESLDSVDPERLAVTGGSGGGTQSMLLAALDDRVSVSFPAVMVSTAMQGGCTCENATLLRVGTGNVEFAALFAPKPQGMSSADDWTKEMSSKGFPELKRHYAMLGAPDNVMLHDRTEFKHNYNQPTRLAMYGWFNQHLALGHSEPIIERDYQRLTREEMSVWTKRTPGPRVETNSSGHFSRLGGSTPPSAGRIPSMRSARSSGVTSRAPAPASSPNPRRNRIGGDTSRCTGRWRTRPTVNLSRPASSTRKSGMARSSYGFTPGVARACSATAAPRWLELAACWRAGARSPRSTNYSREPISRGRSPTHASSPATHSGSMTRYLCSAPTTSSPRSALSATTAMAPSASR